MDAGTITTFITSVGFPIAACCVLAWENHNTRKDFSSQLEKMDMRHDAEVNALSKVIADNSLAIQKLTDKLERS